MSASQHESDEFDSVSEGYPSAPVRRGGRHSGAERPLATGGQARLSLVGERADAVVLRRSNPELRRADRGPGVPAAWDHPHLLRIGGVDEERDALMLEHAPGGTLERLLMARGQLPVGEVVTLMVPLAQALDHLHAHGVAHGDVAPSNVLFRDDGAPVLGDPGSWSAPGAPPVGGGTEGFCAEFAGGAAGDPLADDVYSWGAVCWTAITGEPPAQEEHRVPLPLSHPEVHPDTAVMIEACLELDPSLRPSAAELGPGLLRRQRPAPLDAHLAATPEGLTRLLTQVPVARRRWWHPARLARAGGAWWRPRAAGPARRAPRGAGEAEGGGRWGFWRITLVSLAALSALLAAGVLFLDPNGTKEAATGDPAAAAQPNASEPGVTADGASTDGATADGVTIDGASPPRASAEPSTNPSAEASVAGTASPASGVAAAAPPDAAVTDPAAALVALDAARTRALEAGDAQGLAAVYASSEAAAADVEALEQLRASGLRYQGLSSELQDIELAERDAERVTLTARFVASKHCLAPASGATDPASAAATPASAACQREVPEQAVQSAWTLKRTAAGWRVLSSGAPS